MKKAKLSNPFWDFLWMKKDIRVCLLLVFPVSIDKINIREGILKVFEMHFKNRLNIFETFQNIVFNISGNEFSLVSFHLLSITIIKENS
jgi:hypothetical protein